MIFYFWHCLLVRVVIPCAILSQIYVTGTSKRCALQSWIVDFNHFPILISVATKANNSPSHLPNAYQSYFSFFFKERTIETQWHRVHRFIFFSFHRSFILIFICLIYYCWHYYRCPPFPPPPCPGLHHTVVCVHGSGINGPCPISPPLFTPSARPSPLRPTKQNQRRGDREQTDRSFGLLLRSVHFLLNLKIPGKT